MAQRAANALRLYFLKQTERGPDREAKEDLAAGDAYLWAEMETAAKQHGTLIGPLADIKRAPDDDQAHRAFATALEAVLRRNDDLAKRLETWARGKELPRPGHHPFPPVGAAPAGPVVSGGGGWGPSDAVADLAGPDDSLNEDDAGGLLGGAPWSAPPDAYEEAEPADEPGPAPASGDEKLNPESARAWLNAELEDVDTTRPLSVGETYTLAFSLDPAKKQTLIGSGAPFGFLIPQGTEEVILTVQLNGDDFEILEQSRPLRFRRPGISRGKARFDIVPRRSGRCQLIATVHHAGNFLQQLTLTIQIGDAVKSPLKSSSLGRPISATAGLQPRDIGLAIEASPQGGYTCTAWGATAARVHLPINQQELASAIEQARQALLDVVGQRTFQDGLDISTQDRDAALGILAKAGLRLYQKIFYHPAGGEDARRLGEWLRQQTTNTNEVLKIQLMTQDFPVPWGLLYIDDEWKPDAIDWQRFLGMSHILEQIPLQNTLTTLNGIIDSESAGLSVSVNFNESIDKQMTADFVARQMSYWDDVIDFTPPVTVVSRTKRDELVSALKNGATPDQILYLYCHANAAGLTGGGPDASFLVLSGDEHITLGDLNLEAPTTVQLEGSPLVFINACESAELSPMFYDGFVPYFMAKGARGVIGTECKTPALFAADWATTFFDLFLDGGSLGEIFLRMRRDYYEQHNNPLGILYAVHCDGDTRIQPATIRTHITP
ncbi:CHAT domain-containing protein [Pseudarthrobacter sp. H3Y2-7]|uniref:CHAT domain-containing protein n=1 Tax=Pseudarthrobacter naphthalenicus TaxID=3031328 RepID=UPI0023B02544|nr:CHAT domain-containing protein [Pseudarthrobacter sp. H3Y2-7]MDE8668415.1 CHAT domain-containing protein [Pseudarthrobacter sp. H3Y2-7]